MDECVQPLDVVADRRDRPLHHVLLVRLPAGGEEGEHLNKEIQESGQKSKRQLERRTNRKLREGTWS